MFSYFLSVAVAFIVFSTIGNLYLKLNYEEPDEGYWVIIVVASFLWFVAVPILFVILICFLLNKLTNKIAGNIINLVEKRKSNLEKKDETDV